ncbi:AbrB family transcriptional regulator [Sporolactobacillus sp. CQH2019]|nr:AbrB family transcriptional regulator [Sporolactobacillus sp. CQH2019]
MEGLHMMRNYRKIVKMGNSYGSTIPPKTLSHLGVKPGDEISFENMKDGTVRIKRKTTRLPSGIDEDFVSMVDGIIQDNDAVFKGLVNR